MTSRHSGGPRSQFAARALLPSALLICFPAAADHFRREIANAHAVFRGNFHDGLESELIKVERASLRPFVIGLVDSDDDRSALRADRLRDLEIGGDQPLPAVDDKHKQRCIFQCSPPVLQHLLLKRILAAPEHAGGVGQEKRHISPVRRLLDDVARRPGGRVDDGAAGAGNAVKKCRFPDIRATDQNDGRKLF
jgi:hypothetical protein